MSDRKPFETYAHYKIGKGLATLSVGVDNGDVTVGVAYCHPRDGVNKRKGRSIARGRRDIGSDFSFSFKRSDKKLGDQLRDEFENFVVAAGEELSDHEQAAKALATVGIPSKPAPRVGAPRWTIYSLGREIHRRDKLVKLLDSDAAACDMPELPASCRCC